MQKLLLPALLLTVLIANAQLPPVITSWIINHNGATGYAGITTNVQQVQYSANNVYISSADVADWIPLNYDWPNNPWWPEDQNYVFKITRNPHKNNGTLVKPPYGHTGIWVNGVSMYNPLDAKSWEDSSVWFQNAFYFEHLSMETMDTCLGHPNGSHEYHLHVYPKCLYNAADASHHSPIIGYAFDGFPVYGAYGYADSTGTGPIKRMRSSYRLRNITDRTVLPDGTLLDALHYGPSLNIYPLGAYIEDFEYVQGLGDLDEHNGRYCVTPEYPQGTYAYFVTLDSLLNPQFPYIIGSTYYGTVQLGNTGPNSGHNTISENVDVYTSVNDLSAAVEMLLYPNPAKDYLNFFLVPSHNSNLTATLYDAYGRSVDYIMNVQTAVNYRFDTSELESGLYTLVIENSDVKTSKKIIIAR